jgi:hypothetical protein
MDEITKFRKQMKKTIDDAVNPYKTKIMVHKMKSIIANKPVHPDENKILSEGLEAVASIGESTFAVSTPRRFRLWATEKRIPFRDDFVDRKSWNKKQPTFFGTEEFEPYAEFKQHGYGAWHIGSAISELRKEGRDVFVVNAPRNRRFLFVSRKDKLKQKMKELMQ